MISVRIWISAGIMTLLAILLSVWISKMPMKNKIFVPTADYRLVPKDAILPRGLDIKIDMQTGEKWAKLASPSDSKNDVMFVKEVKEQKKAPSEKQPPAYSNNSNKWKGRFQAVSATIEQALADLEFEVSREDALELLEEEASALEVGAGILYSKNFVHLRSLLQHDPQALNILNICLQNNYPAVMKAFELGILSQDLPSLLQTVDNSQALKRLILLLDSFLIHGDNGEPEGDIVALFKSQSLLSKLLEAMTRTNFTPSERQLEILLRISSNVEQDIAKLNDLPEYNQALSKHCESHPSSKLCQ